MKFINISLLAISLSMLSACSSSPPDDLIEESITEKFPNPAAYQLNSWDEVNSYEREVEGEEIYFIEYKAEFELKPEAKKYLNSGGGISFPHEFYDSTGEVAFVKRGSKWYAMR